MIGWIIGFVILAFIAALFGFGLITTAAVGVAKVLFWIFLIGLAFSIIAHFSRRTV